MIFGIPADEVNAYSTLATAIVAFCALTAAIIQILIGKHEARLALAKSIYKDYLSLAMQNPKFSAAAYPKDCPRLYEIQKDRDEYERYEYFVSYLLLAAEEILQLTRRSQEWRATLRAQLRYHATYLDSPEFPREHYSRDLLALGSDAISEYNEQ